MELDNFQREAVEAKEKKVMVVAGSGSGKTRVIIERIKYLIKEGVSESDIYCITYTQNAAQEIKQRLGSVKIFAGTIHGLANRILHINSIDTEEDITNKDFDNFFFKIKTHNCRIPHIKHLLVDEFQDICDSEYYFIMDMLKPDNFFFVGDSRQSIFSFKGGNYEFFMRMTEDDSVKKYCLVNNYRSGAEIVDFANHFIENLTTIYITPILCKTKDWGIVERVPFSVSPIINELEMAFSYKDWAILCRTNSEVSQIIGILQKHNIPSVSFKKSDCSLSELNEIVNSNTVKVLTIHSAKGLEFENVMVVGARVYNEEERRICYVAATRAKKHLIWLTAPKKKKRSYTTFF